MTVTLETLQNRSIKNMGTGIHSVVKASILEVIKRAYNEGIYVQVSSGYRSNKEQQALYNQGRTTPGNIVTNARPGQSLHNYGLAIDYFLVSNDGSKALWTVNDKWRRVATIAKSLGFEWGGDWKDFVDNPHLQMTGGLSLSQLQAGKKPHLVSKLDQETKPSSKPVSKPSTPSKDPESLVDYLKSKGKDSSFSAREKLANEYGIKNYKGTADQNTSLLSTIKKGKPESINKPKPKPSGSKKRTVTLPASAKTWGTYKLNVKPVKKNIDWYLTPSVYGGLTYEILDEPYPNVVTIKTSKGNRNIYVGNDTSAIIK